MKRPTDKMVHFATAIYNAGFTPSDGQSIDEIIDDFDLLLSIHRLLQGFFFIKD